MSAIVNLVGSEAVVRASLFLYGTYADDTIAKKIQDEINRMWNHPLVMFPYNFKNYKVIFEISCKSVEIDTAKALMKSNTSYENNFVRIEEKNKVERSMMGFGLGQNSGHWLITDNLGESTTAAHEFGHALGLPHPSRIDYRFTGYPPIMAPRGTWVDAEYQWSPLADVGAEGGTMNPKHRRVNQEEVFGVLSGLVEVSSNSFIIGQIPNTFFGILGEPLDVA
jgi:hypothetical protein